MPGEIDEAWSSPPVANVLPQIVLNVLEHHYAQLESYDLLSQKCLPFRREDWTCEAVQVSSTEVETRESNTDLVVFRTARSKQTTFSAASLWRHLRRPSAAERESGIVPPSPSA